MLSIIYFSFLIIHHFMFWCGEYSTIPLRNMNLIPIYRWWNWERDRLKVDRGHSAGLGDRDPNPELPAPGTLITTGKIHEQHMLEKAPPWTGTATGTHSCAVNFPTAMKAEGELLFPLNRWGMRATNSVSDFLIPQLGKADLRPESRTSGSRSDVLEWIFWTVFEH